MKKVSDLMAELGFRKDGSDSVKRAFIENLVRAAGGTKSTPAPQQLSFDFSEEPETPYPVERKRTAG